MGALIALLIVGGVAAIVWATRGREEKEPIEIAKAVEREELEEVPEPTPVEEEAKEALMKPTVLEMVEPEPVIAVAPPAWERAAEFERYAVTPPQQTLGALHPAFRSPEEEQAYIKQAYTDVGIDYAKYARGVRGLAAKTDEGLQKAYRIAQTQATLQYQPWLQERARKQLVEIEAEMRKRRMAVAPTVAPTIAPAITPPPPAAPAPSVNVASAYAGAYASAKEAGVPEKEAEEIGKWAADIAALQKAGIQMPAV